jgi:hypothetical protein
VTPSVRRASSNRVRRPSETRQILAEAGIELKDVAPSGVPTLANYPVSNTDVIRALLDMGADPNPRGRFPIMARDDAGRTALDWALMHGDTPVAALLRQAGTRTLADPHAPPPVGGLALAFVV